MPRRRDHSATCLEEIAAAKFTALLTRRATRDAFDADRLLELAADLLERRGFRLTLVVYAAESRQDVRRLRPEPKS
jgi:hypothetical protein